MDSTERRVQREGMENNSTSAKSRFFRDSQSDVSIDAVGGKYGYGVMRSFDRATGFADVAHHFQRDSERDMWIADMLAGQGCSEPYQEITEAQYLAGTDTLATIRQGRRIQTADAPIGTAIVHLHPNGPQHGVVVEREQNSHHIKIQTALGTYWAPVGNVQVE